MSERLEETVHLRQLLFIFTATGCTEKRPIIQEVSVKETLLKTMEK